MKRKIILLFVAAGIAVAAAGKPKFETLSDTERMQQRGAWSIELNTLLALMNYVNGTYTYRVVPWLALGGGVGVRVLMVDISAQLFARIQTDVPQWNVSPFLILDGGCAAGQSIDFMGNAVLGARFGLRHGNALTFGLGTFVTGYGILTGDYFPLPLLHLGFTF